MKISIKDIQHLFIEIHNININLEFDSKDICIDSRIISNNQVFIALKGVNFDGHNFIENVIKIDPLFFISENNNNFGYPYALVKSSRIFLMDLAKYLLEKTKAIRVGITGSNGKTTTKDLVAHFLNKNFKKYDYCVTKENYNNDIGLPLSIFQISGSEKYLVFEIGTNHPGEIENLTRIIKPNISLITNIGDAHIGNFGSQLEIAKEKKYIFKFLKKNDTKILLENNEFFAELSDSNGSLFTITNNSNSNNEKNLFYESINNNQIRLNHLNQEVEIDFSLFGKHNIDNLVLACAVILKMGFSLKQLKNIFFDFIPSKGRFNKFEIEPSIEVIDDCYNANPKSMNSAIEFLEDSSKSSILIIGDMSELGELSRDYHMELALKIFNSKINHILVTGPLLTSAMKKFTKKNIEYFDSKKELASKAKELIKQDTIILVKASRSMNFEVIINELRS